MSVEIRKHDLCDRKLGQQHGHGDKLDQEKEVTTTVAVGKMLRKYTETRNACPRILHQRLSFRVKDHDQTLKRKSEFAQKAHSTTNTAITKGRKKIQITS